MYERYDDVPWYRKSPHVSLMTLGGIFFGFALVAVCILVLTGNVYSRKRDANGKLKVWGIGNKVAAVILLVLYCVLLARQFGAFGDPVPAAPEG
ncbi:hypothetical protein GobsT_61950 [Gemmata obscuriglobus]|nr:hypothetical protein [Gemmata obscuriglobus]QEG31374.1 hypothetical protein GobsT_61950 [Gemmata obscuriglobus]VTS10714.1 unnamed protein product [Gemmata obscuriglobus UQM 2246]